jgi:Phage protein Gp19/Gp15/Gp42
MADLAVIGSIENAWRPLSTAERPRAEYYLGAASRRIRRRWPDVDARLAAGNLNADDVSDVVVQMVVGALDVPLVRNAKSWSETAGQMSRSVTLQSGKSDLLAIEDWMIAVFEGESTPSPVFCMPPSGRYEDAFIRPEGTR